MKARIQDNNTIKCISKATLFCLVFTAVLVVFSLVKGFLPNRFERAAHGLIGTVAAVLTTVLFLKVERKRFSDIGFRFERMTIIRFFAGIIAGVVLMGALAVWVIHFSDLTIQLNPGSNVWYFLLMTSPLMLLAFMEELGFRAYPLMILKDRLGVRLSIIITSVLFGLYHVVNGWTVASAFYGPAVWGLVFGLAAIYSKGIAMPTGIHYAANLTTSAFGAKNSTACIWTVTQPDEAMVKHGAVDWSIILPALILLLFAVACIELYVRGKLPPAAGAQPEVRNKS